MTRSTRKAHDLVDEQRMVELMSEWARAADATITLKLAELKAELRAEFNPVLLHHADGRVEIAPTLLPTASEGAD